MATVILGIIIAALLGNALRIMYRAFFKGEAACCDSGGGSGCTNCPMKKAMDTNYKNRVEQIEKFEIQRTIDVDGMTCDNCVFKVIRALEKVDGVQIAAASLEKQSAQVGLTKNISAETLREAIEKAGYHAGAVTI
ncbi:MAG: heavy-metal-associated domain-containing protein [Selenomonadaceae bacterium]|nr:heavy-metal-associated domain-containing protein [Selenomonadaceae bacterium]